MQALSKIEISRENILNNLFIFRKLLNKKDKIVAVVKANAYGHGLKEIVSIIEKRVDYFQVDDIEELVKVRKYTNAKVLVLGFVQTEDLKRAISLKCIPTIFDLTQAEELNKIGKIKKSKISVHIEIDAFLGRLGVTEEGAKYFIKNIKDFKFIKIESIYGHFSDIEDSKTLTHANKQNTLVSKISKETGIPYHISATSGFLTDLKNNWGTTTLRLGVGLYGMWPSMALKKRLNKRIKLKPVLSWKTKIAQVKFVPKEYPIGYGKTFVTRKRTKIAVIPQGYSDGYDRGFSNNSEVLIRGKRCKILGRVAMNMFTVDVSKVKGVFQGDEVVIIGKQLKNEITVDQLASKVNTINYEILARISPLLPRKIV